MAFWEKIRQALRSFAAGRYGYDELSKALFWTGMALYILGAVAGAPLLLVLGLAPYAWALTRMFSKDVSKRMAENRRYLTATGKLRTEARQAVLRQKDRKKHLYFRCPNCKKRLRLPRGVGEVTVNCNYCKHRFSKRA